MRIVPLLAFYFTVSLAQAGDLPAVPAQEPPAPCNGLGTNVTIRVACTAFCADSQVKAINAAADQMKIKVAYVVLMDDSGQPKFDLSNPDQNFDAIVSPGGWDTLPGYFAALGPDNPEKKKLRNHMEDLFCTQKLGKTGPFTQKRDSFEFNFDVDTYLKNDRYKDIPFFAACYGMQMMGAAMGMPEYVDIATDIHVPTRSHVTDAITITDTSSRLGHIFPQGSLNAYKNHHQALDLDYYTRHKADFPGLKFVAVSNGGLIPEGLEVSNRAFIGTQFHPEDSSDDVKLPVYKWLLGSACNHVRKLGKRFTASSTPRTPPPHTYNPYSGATVQGCPTPVGSTVPASSSPENSGTAAPVGATAPTITGH